MSDVSAALDWGPGMIGLTLSLGMYGVALGQYGYYLRAFPRDQRALKVLVLVVFIMDTLHSYAMIAYNWVLLISCHHGTSQRCLLMLPWEAPMASVLSYSTTFIVQSFYAHRLWIISGNNKIITAAVSATAVAEFVLGILCVIAFTRASSPTSANTSLVTGGLAAGLSVVCDVLITGSIFFYLQPQRSGIKRMATTIQELINVFVNMGFFTCLVSLVLFTFNWTQNGQYWIGAPAPIICKSYANSMLAVLNARKAIRERAMKTIELRTIPVTDAQESTTETPSTSSYR